MKFTPEQLEAKKRELITKAQALSRNGMAPSRQDFGNANYTLAIKHFGTIANFYTAAGLKKRTGYRRQSKPLHIQPTEQRTYQRGGLRHALGCYDVLDERSV